MVAVEDVINPGEAYRVELVELDTRLADSLDVFFLQWLVVGRVAETIIQGPHLNAFGGFHCENVEQEVGDGVVAEIEVFEMDALLGLTNGSKHIVELFLSAHQQGDGIVVRKGDATLT